MGQFVSHKFTQYDIQSLIANNSVKIDQVFHYTSIATLLKILDTNRLRFSNKLYLNDYSEGKYVLDLCEKKIEEVWPNTQKYSKENFLNELTVLKSHLNKTQFHIYQVSFSQCGDNLTMWNYYAKGDGANIQFSLPNLVKSFDSHFLTAAQWPVGFLHAPVIYDEEQQVNILKRLLNDFANCEAYTNEWYMFVSWAILYVGTFFKHKGFADEKEYRIAYSPFFDPLKPDTCLTLISPNGESYRVELWQREKMLVPYIDVDFDIKAVEKIILSPRLETDSIDEGLKIALRRNGYNTNQVKISKSEIPVRF